MKNLIILLFFIPFGVCAQDLTGVWTGSLYNDSTLTTTKYEIAVTEKNGRLSAYSYAVFHVDNKEVYGVKSLEVIQSKGKIFFRDRDLLVDNYPADAPKGVKQISSIKVFDSLGAQYISGTFTTTRSGKYGRPVTGKIFLVKQQNNLRDITLVKQIIKQGLAPALDFITAADTDKKAKPSSQNDIVKNEAPVNTITTKIDSSGLAAKQNSSVTNETNTNLQKQQTINELKTQQQKTDSLKEALSVVAKNKEANSIQTDVAKNNAAISKEKVIKEETSAQKIAPAAKQKVEETKPDDVKNNTTNKQTISDNATAQTEKKTVKENPVADIKSNITKEQADQSSLQQQKADEKKEMSAEKNNEAKMVATVDTKLPAPNTIQKQPEPKSTNMLTVKKPSITELLAAREIQNIQTVEFTTDSLRLELYDNGTIDGDSVSVIVNGKVVMEHQLLTGKAIPKTVYADGDSLKVVMFAENLGSIAPNTGLLIVYDGKKRYEITFSGDLKKNSAILFKRKRN
jgi:hypothetical protein